MLHWNDILEQAIIGKVVAELVDNGYRVEISDQDGGGLWAFYSALAKDDGHYWHDRLRNAGFKVWQAV